MPAKRPKRKPAIRRLPKSYGIKKLLKGRKATLESLNALTKEVGSFITPVDYSKRGKLGEAMRAVIRRNRAKDDGFAVARKRVVYVKGLQSAEMVPGTNISRPNLLPHGGCHPASLALYEAIRTLGKKTGNKFNPKVSRGKGSKSNTFHTTVVFEFDGKYWEADPFHARIGASIKEITKKDALSRRYVNPVPISYKTAELERMSLTAVKDLLDAKMALSYREK